MLETEARLFANPLAQDIAHEANAKAAGEVGIFAVTCASIVFQTILVSLLMNKFEPGSAEGEAQLRLTYESALKDALNRWHKPDLNDRASNADEETCSL